MKSVAVDNHTRTEAALTLVTFCFLGIRGDRPDDYYVRPLTEFVQRLWRAKTKPRLEIYGNARAKKYLERLPFGNITICEPEDLMSALWDDPNGLDSYKKWIRHNPTHRESCQARFPRVIAVWLGKVEATRRAIDSGAEACFWIDAGHWVSYQCEHDFSRYRSELQDVVRPEGLCQRLLEAARRYGLVGQYFDGIPSEFHMPIEWMYEHARAITPSPRSLPFYSATLWLVHRRHVNCFFDRMRYWWLRLINKKQAGVDENALTLSFWEQRWSAISYREWIKVLAGDYPKPSLHSGSRAAVSACDGGPPADRLRRTRPAKPANIATAGKSKRGNVMPKKASKTTKKSVAKDLKVSSRGAGKIKGGFYAKVTPGPGSFSGPTPAPRSYGP